MQTGRESHRKIAAAGAIGVVFACCFACAGCGPKIAESRAASVKIVRAAVVKPPGQTSGDAVVDAGGAASGAWRADCDYQGGAPLKTSDPIDISRISSPCPQAVMQTARQSSSRLRYGFRGFSPGEPVFLRLYFAEIVYRKPGERLQTIFVNGRPVLRNFDIVSEAGSPDTEIAGEVSTRADKHGHILVTLASAHGGALINALEARGMALTHFSSAVGNRRVELAWEPMPYARIIIQRRSPHGDDDTVTVPGMAGDYQDRAGPPVNGVAYRYTVTAVDDAGGKSAPVSVVLTPRLDRSLRINAGGGAAGAFHADEGFSQESDGSGSRKSVCWTGPVNTTAVLDPAPEQVYQTARLGRSLYFSVGTLAPNRDYTVRLHFTEDDPDDCAVGKRVFSVYDSRRKVFDRVDIFGEAGAAHKVVVKEFQERVDASGSLALAIVADGPTTQTEAKIDAIEILPVSSPAPPTAGQIAGRRDKRPLTALHMRRARL